MLGRTQYKNPKDTTKNNPLYSDFWKKQEVIKKELLNQQNADEILKGNDYDRAVKKQIEDAVALGKEQERLNGTSGDFINDFNFGVRYGKDKFIEPFNKFITPLISKYGGASGKVFSEASQNAGSVIEKLAV